MYGNRCAVAVPSLRKDAIILWPGEDDKNKNAKQIFIKFRCPGCIEVADSAILLLECEPQSDDSPDYKGRKHIYSFTVMNVCDDRRQIQYYLAGFPGSVHENRVYRDTALARNPTDHFGERYALLSDSAVQCSPTVVSAFKCPQGLS